MKPNSIRWCKKTCLKCDDVVSKIQSRLCTIKSKASYFFLPLIICQRISYKGTSPKATTFMKTRNLFRFTLIFCFFPFWICLNYCHNSHSSLHVRYLKKQTLIVKCWWFFQLTEPKILQFARLLMPCKLLNQIFKSNLLIFVMKAQKTFF
jgi:hypothetical protein